VVGNGGVKSYENNDQRVLHVCLFPFPFCLSCNLLIKKPLNTFMSATEPIVIEMFYTLTCPNCRILKRMLQEVLPEFGNKFKLETTLANLPIGMIRTIKLGIYAVPTLLIANEIFREVPSKQDLINKLKLY
jgi:thiol-disulfide isomerase/thioredoxin